MAIKINDTNDVDFTNRSTSVRSILQYNATSDKFILTTIPEQKTILKQSISDSDLPDQFIDVLEDELDLVNLGFKTADGGSF
tara:strand:- start:246 stop:491 length:246 start_codon:yes stop_codon:yes gene_type:complete